MTGRAQLHIPIERRVTTDKGTSLFTTQAIPAGALILTDDRPLITTLDTAKLRDHCEWCLVSGDETYDEPEKKLLRLCKGCKIVRYCSKVRLTCFLLVIVQTPPLDANVPSASSRCVHDRSIRSCDERMVFIHVKQPKRCSFSFAFWSRGLNGESAYTFDICLLFFTLSLVLWFNQHLWSVPGTLLRLIIVYESHLRSVPGT